MSFLKRGRKKDKSHRGTGRETIAPVPVQHTPGFVHVPNQIPASFTEPSTAHRISQVSASSPDIYHEFEPINSLTDSVPPSHLVPQRISTPTKPKHYKKKRGIASIFSRKKSSSLPHLPSPMGLPPLPYDTPVPNRVRYHQQHPVDSSLQYSDLYYQNDHYTTVRGNAAIQSSEEPYPLYSTVRIDPASGAKVTVRHTAVNTPRRSSEAVISTSGETDRETTREISAGGESGGYENEVSLRGLKEGELVPNQDIPTKAEQSVIENTLQILMKQQHWLEMGMKLQQEQLERVTGEKEQSTREEKITEEKQMKRQSRITEPTDTDPTTYSLNQSNDIPNSSLLPSNNIDRIQYVFVPGAGGNGYLRPVGPDGRPLSRHNTLLASDQIRDENSSRPVSSEQLIHYLQDRQVELESKLVELTEQNAELVAQIKVLYQNPASTNPPEDDAINEISYLRQECDRLRDVTRDFKDKMESHVDSKCRDCLAREKELYELKRMVFRLNVELSRYQSLYGDSPLSDTPLPLQQLGADNTPWLSNTSYLSPLLTAYDEQLSEKNTLLRELQGTVTELQSINDTLEGKNDELCRELAKRPLADDMDKSKQQLQLLKEENVVISGDLHSTKQELFQLKTRLKHELNQTDERLLNFEREAERYKGYKASFKSKLESERKCNNDKTSSLREQLSHSESQTHKIQNKLRELSSFVCNKDTEIAEHRANISMLEGKSSAAINSVRTLKQKVSVLERELVVSRSNELTAKGYLQEVVSLMERTAVERDNYAKLANKYETSSQGKESDVTTSIKKRFDSIRDISDTGTSDSLDQSNGDQVLRLTSLIGELQREVIDLKGARNTAEQKLDRILLSLPKQYSSTYSM